MDEKELARLVEQLRTVGSDGVDVEVKEGIGKKVRHTLSAFSNGHGGLLVVGLSESEGFTVVENFDAGAARDQLVSRCAQMTPIVRPYVQLVPFEESVLLVAEIREIPLVDKPCYVTDQGLYGGSYIRSGDSDVVLEQYEIDRLVEEKKQPLWDDELVTSSSTDDIEGEVLGSYLEKERKFHPRIFNQGEDEALKRLHVIREGYPTLASLLVFGDYPQEFFPRLAVSFAQYPGTEKGDVVSGARLLDSKVFEGPMPDIINSAVMKVRSAMRTGAYIDGRYRYEVPDYPIPAVREAVVNALMHRDYSPAARGTQVQINMFVDRLEITSPGGLYGGVTVRNLGKDGLSSSRNQWIARFLERVPGDDGGFLAENRGTGISVMQNSLSELSLPPAEFHNSLSSFTVTFGRRRVVEGESYGSARERVFDLLRARSTASTAEIMNNTNLSRTTVQNAINDLISEGVAEKMEPPRSPRQRYRLTSPHKPGKLREGH